MKRFLYRAIVYTLTATLIASCASTHPGALAESLDEKNPQQILISAYKDPIYSDKSNFFLDFTIENGDGSWLKVDRAEVEFADNTEAPANIIIGQDLVAWSDSVKAKGKVSEHNRQFEIGALMLAGTALMLASAGRSKDLMTAGAVAYAGGAIWSIKDGIEKEIKNAEVSDLVPEGHLLHKGITVPSNGIARRWLLVNFPKDKVLSKGKLILKTVEGKSYAYAFQVQNEK